MDSHKSFVDALAAAGAGEMIVYHEGFLARDRDPLGPSNAPDWAAIGESAWRVGAPAKFILAEKTPEPIHAGGFGAADLTQRALGSPKASRKFEYRITMRRQLTVPEIGNLRALGLETERKERKTRSAREGGK